MLHPDVEEFIIEEAEKLQLHSEIYITIQVPDGQSFLVKELTSIIHRHFETRSEKANQQIQIALKLGLRTLLIGFAFLIIMFLLTRIIMNILPESALLITLKELFIILGWVALWRPAELLLYEWRPYKRNAKLCNRIANCKVHVVP